ncbi:Para-nitrobenzyl esterase [Paragonimus heterotremus]|uniref:Para-nitrobenzyl esterase n=1 Tax=Paragonimus heterotremus TaxID=100268 RepID=A0A8J4X1S4_9TREM|nr:Para-nitrobenzyl esterase [Paragonimus heterotremus]
MTQRLTIEQRTSEIEEIHSLWDDTPCDRSPSVSNLRVSAFRRRYSSACCLNVLLLMALVFAIGAILYLVLLPKLNAWSQNVQTEVVIYCGKINGVQHNNVVTFLGIPYALAPTDENRFKRPVELTTIELCKRAWSQNITARLPKRSVHKMFEYKAPCMQLVPITDELVGSEDCLYLNVFVPVAGLQLGADLKPVVVIINSLFFMYGGVSGLPITQGQQPHSQTIQRADAIHVTFNFRVGPLGFLIHPTIRQANLGLYDQLAALRWVRNNIRSFGGDPTKITLFGYGSGATSVLALSFSHLGQNLFDNVWISAPAVGIPRMTTDQAVSRSLSLFSCDPRGQRKCPQGLLTRAEDIVRLWNWTQVEPWLRDHMFGLPERYGRGGNSSQAEVDLVSLNHILVNDGELIDATRWYRPVYRQPTVFGQTAHETSIYVAPTTVPFWDEAFYRQYMVQKLTAGTTVDRAAIERHIKSNNSMKNCVNLSTHVDFDVEAQLTGLITDARCTCPLGSLAKALIPYGNVVYQYYLRGTHRRFDPYALASFVSLAFHGWDGMIYLRGYKSHTDFLEPITQLGRNGADDLTRLEELSNLLNDAMYMFSRTGQISNWTPVSAGRFHVNLIENGTVCLLTNFLEEHCVLWDELTNGDMIRLAWQV